MRRSSEDRLLRIARKQFKRCEDYEGPFHTAFLDDLRFANADPENGWAWPEKMLRDRRVANKVSLTLNQIRTLNNMIINEVKKNPPGIIVRPTGGGATVQSAKAYSNWMRAITQRSRFSDIVTRASRFQVDGGVAYWRVLTEWEDGQFTQRVKIASVQNPLSVYLDPDAKEPDKSDAKFGFVFEDELKEDVHAKYPRVKDFSSQNTLDPGPSVGWMTESHYRVAEWFNLETVRDQLIMITDPDSGDETIEYLSKIPSDLHEEILADPMTQRREVDRKQMKWRKVIGSHIVDERDWPGRYVPIVQVVGDEIVVDGTLDRKGNTRLLKDAQRMTNYWMSNGTQSVALQSKVPWLVDVRAIEQYENYWATANVVDHAYLPYRSYDEQGRQIAPPQRQVPPEMSQAYVMGMQLSDRQLMTISGQREPTRDMEADNLRSGRAILTRKAQGEQSTYGFRDNIDIAVAYTGRIIIDLIPAVYDTARQIMTVGPDMKESEIYLDPNHKSSYDEQQTEGQDNKSQIIFNPRKGGYDVDAVAGPDYSTERQYAVEAMSTAVSQNTALWGVLGDLLVKNMDFPGADEMAERLRRTIPKSVLGEGPDPDTQALMDQNQRLESLIENFTALLAEKNLQLKNKDEELTIEVENAITRRIKEVGNAVDNLKSVDLGDEARQLIMQAVQEALSAPISKQVKTVDDPDMTGANTQTADVLTPPGLPKPAGSPPAPAPTPQHPNGKIAPDGNEYVEHAPGQFAQVGAPNG